MNVKAGGCSENCKFCAQSALYQTDSPRYGLVEMEPMEQAADEAKANGVTALGLVAAARIEEGPVLTRFVINSSNSRRAAKPGRMLLWELSKTRR